MYGSKTIMWKVIKGMVPCWVPTILPFWVSRKKGHRLPMWPAEMPGEGGDLGSPCTVLKGLGCKVISRAFCWDFGKANGRYIEYGVYGDLIIIYPNPCSIYLRGTIGRFRV